MAYAFRNKSKVSKNSKASQANSNERPMKASTPTVVEAQPKPTSIGSLAVKIMTEILLADTRPHVSKIPSRAEQDETIRMRFPVKAKKESFGLDKDKLSDADRWKALLREEREKYATKIIHILNDRGLFKTDPFMAGRIKARLINGVENPEGIGFRWSTGNYVLASLDAVHTF